MYVHNLIGTGSYITNHKVQPTCVSRTLFLFVFGHERFGARILPGNGHRGPFFPIQQTCQYFVRVTLVGQVALPFVGEKHFSGFRGDQRVKMTRCT